MENKNYVVFFKGKRDWDRIQQYHVLNTEINGYYAEKQPNYRWSFTDDINKAKVYKTLNAAEKRVKHASGGVNFVFKDKYIKFELPCICGLYKDEQHLHP
jgi:hypothetical protein